TAAVSRPHAPSPPISRAPSRSPMHAGTLPESSRPMTGNRLGFALLLTGSLLALPTPVAAAGAQHGPAEAIFLLQIILLLVVGRLLGEGMQRIGQPAIMGQLIAGVLLGPSVLGAIWPELQHTLFPRTPEQKAMLDAVSQLGILMLLLL